MTSCRGVPARSPERVSIWYVASVAVDGRRDSASQARNEFPEEGGLVVLDTASLRPIVVAPGGSGFVEERRGNTFLHMDLARFALLTTYQGGRHHPETIRAIAGDSAVLRGTAQQIVRAASLRGSRLILDLQGIDPDDLPAVTDLARAVRDAATRLGRGRPLGILVPPGDTVSYPTEVLARVADVLVLRLHGEHRAGTAPGPLTTPEFIAREIGVRARIVGANRLVAELPLYGYRWHRDGTAVPITYSAAQALVVSEAGEFRRDPASQFLVATGRDGWTVWIPDARTVEFMIDAVLRRDVNEIALAGLIASDPAIAAGVRNAIRR